jgi:hypothetical protein
MTQDFRYPEEVKMDALYRPVTIRNYHLPTLKALKIIAIDSGKTLSDIFNAAGKEYVKNHCIWNKNKSDK